MGKIFEECAHCGAMVGLVEYRNEYGELCASGNCANCGRWMNIFKEDAGEPPAPRIVGYFVEVYYETDDERGTLYCSHLCKQFEDFDRAHEYCREMETDRWTRTEIIPIEEAPDL